MEVMVLDTTDDLEMLREISNEWAAAAHGSAFGIQIEVNTGLNTLRQLVMQSNGDVLVLMDGETVKGFMGLQYGSNIVGAGKVVNECLFFVSRSARGGGVKLLHSAEELGRVKGCNFSTMNASRVGGDTDRSGQLYERCGYQPFEYSYIKAL